MLRGLLSRDSVVLKLSSVVKKIVQIHTYMWDNVYYVSIDRLIFTKLGERLTGKASLGALRHYIVVYWHKLVLSWPFVDGFKEHVGCFL